MIKTLRDLIAQGEIRRAVDLLLKVTASDARLHNKIIALSARLASYENQLLGDLESSTTLKVEWNKINQALLAFIDELEGTEFANIPATTIENPKPASETKTTGSMPTTSSWTKWTGLNDVKSWVALLAGLAAILTFYFKFCSNSAFAGELTNVTVNVRDKNDDLIEALKTKGYVIMTTSGGGSPRELIDDKCAASFRNIKIGDKVRLNIDFSEPYRPLKPDSVYTVPADGRIQLEVALQHLGKIYGRILYRDKELPGVIVAVGNLRDTTDDLGRYEILIPEAEQQKEQEVFFKAVGFKSMTKKVFPQTNQPVNMVMEK